MIIYYYVYYRIETGDRIGCLLFVFRLLFRKHIRAYSVPVQRTPCAAATTKIMSVIKTNENYCAIFLFDRPDNRSVWMDSSLSQLSRSKSFNFTLGILCEANYMYFIITSHTYYSLTFLFSFNNVSFSLICTCKLRERGQHRTTGNDATTFNAYLWQKF